MSSGGLLASTEICLDRFKIQFEKGPSAQQSGSYTYMVQESASLLRPKAVRNLQVNDTVMEPYSRQTTKVTFIEPLTAKVRDLWMLGTGDSYVFSKIGKVVAVDRNVNVGLYSPSGVVTARRIRRRNASCLRVGFRDGSSFAAAIDQRLLLESVVLYARRTLDADMADLRPGQMIQGLNQLRIVQDTPVREGAAELEVYCIDIQSSSAKADEHPLLFADGLLVLGCSLS